MDHKLNQTPSVEYGLSWQLQPLLIFHCFRLKRALIQKLWGQKLTSLFVCHKHCLRKIRNPQSFSSQLSVWSLIVESITNSQLSEWRFWHQKPKILSANSAIIWVISQILKFQHHQKTQKSHHALFLTISSQSSRISTLLHLTLKLDLEAEWKSMMVSVSECQPLNFSS